MTSVEQSHAHRLAVHRTDPGRIAALAARYPRIGLDGLIAGRAGRPSRGRWVRVPARAAVTGFRWSRRDGRDRDWWPQGIDLRVEPDGRRILAVSWYARPRRGGPRGTRIAFVELRPGEAPRYWRVLLIEAEGSDGLADPGIRPVAAHAGGLAWRGDRLYVASTFDGVRVFDLRDILDSSRPGLLGLGRRGAGPDGALALLPQREHWMPAEGAERMRYSFLSLDRRHEGETFIAGEYLRDEPAGRLVELARDGDSAATIIVSRVPGLLRMQGAAMVDERCFVTTSSGTMAPGDLWVGEAGRFTRHAGVLPPGPEDLALEPGTRTLWSLSEQPGRRWVLTIDADAWAG